MRTYKLTFSNLHYSYSHIIETNEDDDFLIYIPGEWIGEESLKKVCGHLEGLLQSDDCPPIFKREPITRVLVEDLTKTHLPKMPKEVDDVIL